MDGLFHLRRRYYRLQTHLFTKSDSLKLNCLNDGFVSSKCAAFGFTIC